MTKDELLASIERERARLMGAVEGLDEAAIAAPSPDDAWSVKDHLAHIAAWERMIVAHLRDGSDAAVAEMDTESYKTASLDELNEQLYRRARDRTVDEVRDEFQAAHEEIVAQIERMAEEELAARYWDDDPSGKTVLDKIVGDTYEHYGEHAEWIRELLARTADAR